MDERERFEKGHVLARVIIEMLGAPKEHIEKTLKDYVEKLDKEAKDYEIVKAEFEEATEQGKFFAAFTEVDIWFHKPGDLINFCFDSMPSSVDILRPNDLKIGSKEFSDFLNDLQAHIHQLDASVKKIKATNKLLDQNSTAVFRNFIVYLLNQGKEEVDEFAEHMGVAAKDLKPFMSKLAEQGVVEEKEGKYYLVKKE